MLAKGKVLIVDDDRGFRESLMHFLESEGYVSGGCGGGIDALAAMDNQRWDLALVDIRMPGIDGLELLARTRALHSEIPVIVITGYGSVDTAVRALKGGAEDYVVKPFPPADLAVRIDRAMEKSRALREVERLKNNLREVSPKADLVGQSAAMIRVREQVETVAPTDATVLITGERGTGKEIVARAIHVGSPRSHMPMAVVRCGALPEALLEGELFGHERNDTEESPRKKGKFEIADGGTVLLDEISEVSRKTQAELLAVLETKEMIRLGGTKPTKVDFRWIAASNRSLEAMVREGGFRAELYYRLNVFPIDLPPLRERREDVPILVDHFFRKHAALMNRPVPAISKKAMELLLAYQWPGNVRELENAVERALLISHDEEIRPANFPFQQDVKAIENGQTLAEMEKRHIRRIVEQAGWNLSKSARILGIDRTTLYNKLRRYGMK